MAHYDSDEDDGICRDFVLGGDSELGLQLYGAIRDDNAEKLLELLSNGASVNTIYEDETLISTKSILHMACEKGSRKCVQILVDKGSRLISRDSWGQIPLMFCMITQWYELAEIMLKRDSRIVDHQDKFGKSPLHCAVESGCMESIDVLLKYGANVNIQNHAGITPLMLGVSVCDACDDYRALTLRLINAGAELEVQGFSCKRTALQMAVVGKNMVAVEVLLEAGADPNTVDTAWRPPLTNAIASFVRKKPNGDYVVDDDGLTIMMQLITGGADINMRFIEQANPILQAIFIGVPSVVQLLLDYGAILDIEFKSGMTPLLIAVRQNNREVMKTILQWNCPLQVKGRVVYRRQEYVFDPFELALFFRHLNLAKCIVLAGYNLQNTDYLKACHNTDDDDMRSKVPEMLKTNELFLSWLYHRANNPETLQRLASFCIRDAMKAVSSLNVRSLPLPQRLKELIRLDDVFEEEEISSQIF